MSKQEYLRLYSYHSAKRYSPWKPVIEQKGRRSIKGKAKGVHQVLKDSRVTSQTLSIEK